VTKLLLIFVFFSDRHWVTVKDSYMVHKRFVNHYGLVIGDYYQPHPWSWQPAEVLMPFTAQCYEKVPIDFNTELEATNFVLDCPKF
jgi:hypothetical protein